MLFERWFWIVVNEPAMNTREPTTSMSQISPLLIFGMSVRGVSGTSAVWLGAPGLRRRGCGAHRASRLCGDGAVAHREGDRLGAGRGVGVRGRDPGAGAGVAVRPGVGERVVVRVGGAARRRRCRSSRCTSEVNEATGALLVGGTPVSTPGLTTTENSCAPLPARLVVAMRPAAVPVGTAASESARSELTLPPPVPAARGAGGAVGGWRPRRVVEDLSLQELTSQDPVCGHGDVRGRGAWCRWWSRRCWPRQ